jgi:DNA-binding transcriptional LysR family regulator
MELTQIRHFIAVAETGSFTKGAHRATVSQPAISASIAKLEAYFDVKLLDRRRSPVVPTAAGTRLLEAGREILQNCNAVKAELKTIATPKLLRFGVLQSLSSRQVSKLLGSFRDTHSHVAIEVCDALSEQLVEMLTEQQLDAVVTILDESASKFASRVLFKEPYVLAVPVAHRFAQRESVTPADLEGEPFIVRTGRDKFLDASHALVTRGIKIRVVYKTAQIDRTLALIAAGVGLSFIPAHLATPAVKQVPVAHMDFSRTYGLLWSHERENDLKEFIEFAESHCWMG